MAEFLWTFAVQEVLKKVLKLAAEQIGVAWGLEKELSKLREGLLHAEAILRDINRKRLHHESVSMWVDNLQDIVYEADDLLDELVYEDLRQTVETEKRKKVRNFFTPSNNPFLIRWKMAKTMKDITETLDRHYLKASSLGVVGLVGEESTETNKNIDLMQFRETTSILNFEVIGREVEVSNIVKQVIDSSNKHLMSIIPIVGMGGIGKTTLAKAIFNHKLIKGHFDKTVWICVSEPFIITNILEGVFQSLTKTPGGLNSKENLVKSLQEEMQGKNYFLVLDDVWNEEASLWRELKDCLKEIAGKSGNVIIVTTRSEKVATIMETTSSHHVNKLSDDQCWSLFKESANANGLVMNPELEAIRVEMVTKIGGVPLVAKVVGGSVMFEGNFERWVTQVERVVKNISKDDKDFVLSILKLSVDRLPLLSLKQCFAYCSNFPKDHLYNKESLIQMWIAQGFVQPQEGDNEMMMEDIGEGYFNLLLSRSLFQDVSKDIYGRITHFTMHDLIHDVSYIISNRQKLELELPNWSEKGARKFRTLVTDDYKVLHPHKLDFLCLRVLVVNPFYRIELLDSIGMLKHLRYLEIIDYFARLPESITMLYNLQTLKLEIKVDLPKNLRKLVRLRHLKFFCSRIQQMPSHMSQLIHLQTLDAFVVGFGEGCTIEELGPLKNLKGSLKLPNLERVKSKAEAINAKLMEKQNLRRLHFIWRDANYEQEDNNNNHLDVLEGLQPHKNLQSLSIIGFGGQVLPNTIFVENLVVILLEKCTDCEKLPMLGQLPNLEEINISSLDSVRSIESEFYGNNSNQRVYFPKLRRLTFDSMRNLEQWENVTNGTAFSRLEGLCINTCSKLMRIPDQFESLQVLRILECEEFVDDEQPNVGCKHLQIYNCPNLTLNGHNMHNFKEVKIVGCIQDYDFGPLIQQSSIMNICLVDALGTTTQLPQQLQHFIALKALTIKDFDAIEVLPDWLQNLTSLESLKLLYCINLKQLPSKEAMLHLTKLNHLYVRQCPWLQLNRDHPEGAKLSHLLITNENEIEITFKRSYTASPNFPTFQ